MFRSAVLLVVLAVSAVLIGPSASSSAAGQPVPLQAGSAGCPDPDAQAVSGPWRHPVDAPVVDWFRRPSHAYGPGNRGLEYRTSLGDPVTAVAAGSVVFAGPVGLSRFVVIEHQADLRSTAAYLVGIDVAVGDAVAQGQTIGSAAEGFHLTARRDGDYLDPMTLIGGYCFVVRLVPVPEA